MQLPKADIPGETLAIHPINKDNDYGIASITVSYNIYPQVYHRREPLHTQVLIFQ